MLAPNQRVTIYAEMVSNAYKIEASENKTLYVYGPEKMTLMDALKTYCTIVRRMQKYGTNV